MTEFNDDLDSLIIYEDKNILVVNKPSGLLTIKDGYDPFLPNLYDILIANYQKLWAVHRLDKETSGVLVFAKSADAHRFLNTQFDNRLISKSYNAIVHGVPEWEEKTIDSYLKSMVIENIVRLCILRERRLSQTPGSKAHFQDYLTWLSNQKPATRIKLERTWLLTATQLLEMSYTHPSPNEFIRSRLTTLSQT